MLTEMRLWERRRDLTLLYGAVATAVVAVAGMTGLLRHGLALVVALVVMGALLIGFVYCSRQVSHYGTIIGVRRVRDFVSDPNRGGEST